VLMHGVQRSVQERRPTSHRSPAGRGVVTMRDVLVPMSLEKQHAPRVVWSVKCAIELVSYVLRRTHRRASSCSTLLGGRGSVVWCRYL
jgi:hypothetical protein